MENLEPEFIILTKDSKKYLFSIAKWAKIVAIIGFLIVLFVFLAFVYSLGFSGYTDAMNTKQMVSFLVSLLFVVLYFYSMNKLYNFSKYCKKSLMENDSMLFELSLQHLKQNFKIIGLFTLIITIIYLLLFITITVGGSMAHKYF